MNNSKRLSLEDQNELLLHDVDMLKDKEIRAENYKNKLNCQKREDTVTMETSRLEDVVIDKLNGHNNNGVKNDNVVKDDSGIGLAANNSCNGNSALAKKGVTFAEKDTFHSDSDDAHVMNGHAEDLSGSYLGHVQTKRSSPTETDPGRPTAALQQRISTPDYTEDIAKDDLDLSPVPIIRLHRSRSDIDEQGPIDSTESQDNPFVSGGELDTKADYILSHSLISRTEIRISDPDISRTSSKPAVEEPLVASENAQQVEQQAPSSLGAAARPRENGKPSPAEDKEVKRPPGEKGKGCCTIV